jgi:hypothetical protein
MSGARRSGLVGKLRVSPSRSRLSGPHRYYPGIVQQAQGRSSETAVSPHHNNQSTIRHEQRNAYITLPFCVEKHQTHTLKYLWNPISSSTVQFLYSNGFALDISFLPCIMKPVVFTPTIFLFLAYLKKMKAGISNYQSVCLSPTNNVWTA